MKNYFILIFVICALPACTYKTLALQSPRPENVNEWELIKKISVEKMSKENLISYLGAPYSVLKDKNDSIEYFIYQDTSLNVQKWSIEFQQNGKLSRVTFFPNVSNRENFTIEKVIENWGKNCIRKKDIDKNQHFVMNIYYLDCESQRRAYLNNHDEISSLSLTIQ